MTRETTLPEIFRAAADESEVSRLLRAIEKHRAACESWNVVRQIDRELYEETIGEED